MFLKIDNQTITLILLAVCIIPIAVLALFAIFKTIKNQKKKNKVSCDEVDLEQQEIFYNAYGGNENVLEVNLEMNRVTVKVVDIEKVDGEKLKELGATGVLLVGDLVKASYSDRAKYVYKLMEK